MAWLVVFKNLCVYLTIISRFVCFKQYRHLKNISLATLGYGENEDSRTGLKFCKQHYKTGAMFSSNKTLNIDSDIETGNSSDRFLM